MLSSIIVVMGLKLMKTLQDTIRRGAPGRRNRRPLSLPSYNLVLLIQTTYPALYSVIAKKIAELELKMCYKFLGQVIFK